MKYIIHTGTPQDLGGKGYGLLQLQQAGFRVPEWFAVSPQVFEASLNSQQRSALHGGDVERIRTALESVRIDPQALAELEQAIRNLSRTGSKLAVRSSALEEDAPDHSFAGQLESYLSVSPSGVPEKVAAVWRSGFSERVLAYRLEKGMAAIPRSAPAVIVQRMVDAQAAGVAFGADPVSGRTGIVVISAVPGLADRLVSGESNSDDYEVDRSGTVSQVRKAACGTSGSTSRVLTDRQAETIAATVRIMARQAGHPQDIEWAIQGETLYTLQTRPITTLNQLSDPDAVRHLWDNSNIMESYSGVTTPLTFSFARTAYEGVYREFCRILRVPEAQIAAHDGLFGQMLGLIRGRVYYNLLNWYRILALLPGFTINRGFMEQMMGVKEPLPNDVVQKLSGATSQERIRDAWHLTRMLAALVSSHFTLDQKIKRFYSRLNAALADCVPCLGDMRIDELAASYEALVDQLLTRWDAPLLNDFFTMIFHGLLRQLCGRWLQAGDELANELVRDRGQMISVEPAVRLREMGAIVARTPELAQTLRCGELSQSLGAIRRVEDLHRKYNEYLAKFGERCLEELKLESPTLLDDPSLLLRSIGELACLNEPGRGTSFERRGSAAAELRVSTALRWHPLRRRIFAWVLRNASERVRARENLRFERTRVFGRVRSIFVEIGVRLHALKRLDNPRDVFYLQVDEVLGFVNGSTVSANFKDLVTVRKREFAAFCETPAPPDRFETRGAVHQTTTFRPTTSSQPAEVSGGERYGLGCCAGTVRGRACVVTDPRTASLPAGCILVAKSTDPGWIILFPAAAGLIVERGSLLSHSAIVSRELGIPSVVSVSGVTNWLRDGDLVEIDGGKGIVRRLRAEGSVA